MTKPSFKEPTDDEKPAIIEMRTGFHAEFVNHLDLYYQKDWHRVIEEDWHVHRYLMAADGNAKAGLKRLIYSMRWRRKLSIWDMRENDFPIEFFQMIRLGSARDGSTLMVTRVKFSIPLPEWTELSIKFFVFVFEWLDRHNTGNGITILVDYMESGLSNIDFDFILFIKPIQSKYYPFLLKALVNCDIPWILTPVAKLILSFLSEKTRKLIVFLRRPQLNKYITEDNIPIYMGGTGKSVRKWFINHSLSAEEVAVYQNFSNKNLKKLVAHIRPLLSSTD